MTVALWLIVAAGYGAVAARWLRVAQREHYEPGRVSAIVRIWCRALPANLALGLGSLVAVIAGWWAWPLTVLGIAVAVIWPWGLGVRGRTSQLAFTGRMKRLAAVLAVLVLVVCLVFRDPGYAALGIPLAFALTDLALLITKPIEAALAQKYVASARAKLAKVNPQVIAITGSYGKTSTKLYAAQLLSASRSVLASPASFNNLLGLSRTVNDRLTPGTEIFIAEMGTYGPGEIRQLCSVFPPSIAAITTIGEAHLERMKDRATIVSAKSEIAEQASTVVLNVDVPELAALADRLDGSKKVIRVGTKASADVVVTDAWKVTIGAESQDWAAQPTGHPTNLAVAIGLALAAGAEPAQLLGSVRDLPQAPHRAEVAVDANGVTLIDDTYNSNPDGAASAIAAAAELAGPAGAIYTVTPGMIELGREQFTRNAELAAQATASLAMRLVVIGHTNRRALVSGATAGDRVELVRDRAAAVALIGARAQPGDVVLYENDLPDHYP